METATRQPLGFWRGMFWVLVGLGLVSTYLRFFHGLGAVTNLSDAYPWGLWVGFKLCCVGLAAGGFVLTAVVEIFDIERFKSVVRPAVLTAFLGYMCFVTCLLFDLGRPWNLWHPVVMWNPHSVMFEVAWCVMLYSTVLMLELSGVVFERLAWTRAARVQRAITIPLVVAGVVLSILHQSSLGSLYLIVPEKLHAIWFTPWQPVLFFVSAISMGLAMLIVESRLASRAFGRRLDPALLGSLAFGLIPVLGLYGLLRLGDLAQRGMLGAAFSPTYEGSLFLVEFVLGLVLPLALLVSPRLRASGRGRYVASLFVVLGFVTQRFNVSITGFEAAQGGHYLPAWGEGFITLMLVALAFGAFSLAVRHLPVFPAEASAGSAGSAAAAVPAAGTRAASVRRRPAPGGLAAPAGARMQRRE